MSAVYTIWKKEMRVYAVNPTAYAFLAVFLFLSGLFFYLGITLTGEASLRVLASNLAIAELFILPMLTMRHFAEERRQGTLEMLLTSPISPTSLVVGKWLASMTLCAFMFLGTGVLPVILAYYGDPDWGVVASTYVGLFLAAGAFCAAGLFSSTLLDDQLAAGLIGILLLLPFWLVSRAEALVGDELGEKLQPFGVVRHLDGFGRGVIDSADVYYFVAMAFCFLLLTTRSLESRRWR